VRGARLGRLQIAKCNLPALSDGMARLRGELCLRNSRTILALQGGLGTARLRWASGDRSWEGVE
jgi:hypothetical protein